MAAEAGDTSYSELQKFKKSSEPGSVLECWKGLAADLAPRLQEIAQFVIAPDLAAVESAQAQLRNELLQSNRDVVALGDEENGNDQADQGEECDDQEEDEGEPAAECDKKKRPRSNGAGPLWSAMQHFIKTDSL
ncbi:unnamed protein product [Symbiodinium sp. CCMP2592]|nr:unnamed protein product [Symbiodinium sp. CCMP2592]